ncbi:hypothetical protein PMAYCL1PPCAC_12927, partial [Pristionchus mayeri]
ASVHRNAKSRDLLLNRHSTIESINEVMKNMTKNGKLNEMPNNATFVTTLELAKSTAYDYSGLSYYTEPSGRYLILVEENDHFMPWISLRLPSDSLHDLPLLRACISEILEVHLETIGERKEFELDCDSEAMNAVLSMLGNPRFVPDGNCAYFHMNDEQCAALMKKEYVVPDGFVVRRVDEKDFDVVIDTWKHLDSRTLVKERLRHLPSIGVYSKEGKLASFMSTHTMGQMSHVYTLPEFRGKGLGTVAEMRLAQDFIQRGLRPHKCVSFTNESVYAQSLRNPFYYEWKRPDGQHYCWNYNRIEY